MWKIFLDPTNADLQTTMKKQKNEGTYKAEKRIKICNLLNQILVTISFFA